MEYSILDFINADITISRIDFVYHYCGCRWARPDKLPRKNEGLLFFLEGGIEYDFGDFGFAALPGQILRLPSGIPYNGRKLDNNPNHFYCIDFLTAKDNEYLNLPLPYSFTPSDPSGILDRFKKLEQCWHSKNVCSILDCKSILSELIITLIKDYAFNICHCDDRSQIIQYCDFIRKNANDCNFRIDKMTEYFHISGTHLRRIFRSEIGVSPSEYLASIRLDSAKNLLLTHPELTIGEISENCGYSSIYYFSTMFRKIVGMTPSEFRLNSFL